MKIVFLYVTILNFIISCNTKQVLGPPQTSQDVLTENYAVLTDNTQKVHITGFIWVTIKNIEYASKEIKTIVKKQNGYIQEIETERFVIRVKSNLLDDTIDAITTLGKVTHKNIVSEDVSERYQDYQIRLENATKARTKYLALLEKAENVTATLQVERELERLNTTIDSLKGKIKRINHLNDYATITINLKQKKKLGIFGYLTVGVYHAIKWLFVRD